VDHSAFQLHPPTVLRSNGNVVQAVGGHSEVVESEDSIVGALPSNAKRHCRRSPQSIDEQTAAEWEVTRVSASAKTRVNRVCMMDGQ